MSTVAVLAGALAPARTRWPWRGILGERVEGAMWVLAAIGLALTVVMLLIFGPLASAVAGR